jgi:hypothetical protein
MTQPGIAGSIKVCGASGSGRPGRHAARGQGAGPTQWGGSSGSSGPPESALSRITFRAGRSRASQCHAHRVQRARTVDDIEVLNLKAGRASPASRGRRRAHGGRKGPNPDDLRAGGARSASQDAARRRARPAGETWHVHSVVLAGAHDSAESSGATCVLTRLAAGTLVELDARTRQCANTGCSQAASGNHQAYGTAKTRRTADVPRGVRVRCPQPTDRSVVSCCTGRHPAFDRTHPLHAGAERACMVKTAAKTVPVSTGRYESY